MYSLYRRLHSAESLALHWLNSMSILTWGPSGRGRRGSSENLGVSSDPKNAPNHVVYLLTYHRWRSCGPERNAVLIRLGLHPAVPYTTTLLLAGKGVWVGVKTTRFEDIQPQPRSLCRAALHIQVCKTEICSQMLYHWVLPLFITYFYFMFISVHECLCDGVRSPGTGVTDSCELSCGCWNQTRVLWKYSQYS